MVTLTEKMEQISNKIQVVEDIRLSMCNINNKLSQLSTDFVQSCYVSTSSSIESGLKKPRLDDSGEGEVTCRDIVVCKSREMIVSEDKNSEVDSINLDEIGKSGANVDIDDASLAISSTAHKKLSISSRPKRASKK